jgi:methylated-DNA-protein-cysteine methyltransferase-like protein
MLKLENKNQNLFDWVYKVVKKIPKGKVATYGQIAETLGIKDARRVGWALHANKDPKIPCHRVVDRNGRIAPNFAFDGAKEQRIRLLSEGIVFKDEMHVDLARFLLGV